MTPNKKRNINLHIEKLVLDGIPSQDRNTVASVVQQELHRMLGQGDLPQKLKQTGDISKLNGGTIQMDPKASEKNTGNKIARNLYRGLQQ